MRGLAGPLLAEEVWVRTGRISADSPGSCGQTWDWCAGIFEDGFDIWYAI